MKLFIVIVAIVHLSIVLFVIVSIAAFCRENMQEFIRVRVDALLGRDSDECVKCKFNHSEHLNSAITRHFKMLFDGYVLKFNQMSAEHLEKIGKVDTADESKISSEGL